jgi:4a-hydroxytetrahydrobiopterin dehydratase
MEQAFSLAQIKDLLKKVPEWELDKNGTTIYREFVMKDFVAAVDLINEIKRIAQLEGHHPDIHLTAYRNLRVELSTHEAGGLSEKDFILAGRIDKLPAELKEPT